MLWRTDDVTSDRGTLSQELEDCNAIAYSLALFNKPEG
jgi:hypothetical protein